MQEIMGFHFEIQMSKRIKRWRIVYDVKGFFIFHFPYYIKNTQRIVEQYIKENHVQLNNFLLKQQTKFNINNNLVEQYLNEYPNTLVVFGTQVSIKELTIESLSQKLYVKSKEILDEYALKMQLNYTKLTISHAKSYLGQCDAKARIKIDYRNVLCDERLLCYLAVHELAHIRYPNHSKLFWQEVERFYPNCKSARKELKIIANRNALILKHYGLLHKNLC
ncbi:M48 metallopeptidase family protein [Helicobacter trogontum]|nr:M48 family metallopeptidase [Helicobacter trogontum]